jgi:hypothetical protein
MIVKGMNGESHNVTSQGQGNYNTVGASAGIASFLGLNAGNLLGGLGNCGNTGWGWNRNGNCGNGCDTLVSRYEAAMMQELASKDGKIALLESNIYTDSKIADVYERLNVKINTMKDEQNAINMQQAVYNGTNTATIACIKSQVAELASLSELVIPSRRVCDTGCCGCNS